MASENMLVERGIETWRRAREGGRESEISGIPAPLPNTQKKARIEGQDL